MGIWSVSPQYCDLRTRGLNQLADLVQNIYLGSSRKYLETFFSFPPNPKIKDSSHKKKKLKNLIFSKMAPAILIKFCGLIVYSIYNIVILATFAGKIPETGKIFLNFYFRATLGVKEVGLLQS